MQPGDKKTAWEGRFIRSIILAYKDHSGNLRNWEAVERVNCNGIIAVVPVTKNGELLLIRQFRPVVNNFVVEFPAGLNDKGESLVNAARRELIEETGYTADDFVFLCEGPLSSGLSTEILSVFLAKDAVPATNELKQQYPAEETENIEIIKTPMTELYDTLEAFRKNGDYIDLKIYGLVEMAKDRLKVKG
jgi:8-oxo-dGTP pyrophosphatase MutT (NUDIX family)